MRVGLVRLQRRLLIQTVLLHVADNTDDFTPRVGTLGQLHPRPCFQKPCFAFASRENCRVRRRIPGIAEAWCRG